MRVRCLSGLEVELCLKKLDCGERQEREELFGRELLRSYPMFLRDVGLGDAKRNVDHGRSKNLHRNGIGVRRVEALEVEHDLQVVKKALDLPALRVESRHVLGWQPLGVEHVRQGLVCLAPVLQDHEAQLDLGSLAAGLDNPVLKELSVGHLSAQASDLLDRDRLVQPEDPKGRIGVERPKERNAAVEAISKDQAVGREALDGLEGSVKLGCRSICLEPELRGDSSKQVVHPEEATRQDHGLLGAEDLQPVGDLVEPRAVDDKDVGKLLPEVRQLLAVAPGSLRLDAGHESPVEGHEEARAHRLRLLEERLGAGRDVREQARGVPSPASLQQLAEGARSRQHDSKPEVSQRVERPPALALGDSQILVNLTAEHFADVLVEELHRRRQVNADLAITVRALPLLGLLSLHSGHDTPPFFW